MNTEKKYDTPFELFGVECGSGWNDLLKPIFSYIEKYNESIENDDGKIEIHQVKEKFGTLRFYCNFVTDELRKIIYDAEYESSKTCELCGSKDNVGHTIGWITTCCNECAKKMSIKHPVRWKPNNCQNDVKWIEIDNKIENIIYK